MGLPEFTRFVGGASLVVEQKRRVKTEMGEKIIVEKPDGGTKTYYGEIDSDKRMITTSDGKKVFPGANDTVGLIVLAGSSRQPLALGAMSYAKLLVSADAHSHSTRFSSQGGSFTSSSD